MKNGILILITLSIISCLVMHFAFSNTSTGLVNDMTENNELTVVLAAGNYATIKHENGMLLARFFRNDENIGEVYFKDDSLDYVSNVSSESNQKVIRIRNGNDDSFISANVANASKFFSVRDRNHDLIPEYVFENDSKGVRAYAIEIKTNSIDLAELDSIVDSDLIEGGGGKSRESIPLKNP